MCLNPIYVKNKSKARYGGFEYVATPCRNCAECSQVMQQDYLIRTISLINSLPANYSYFFCTLTFRPADLPTTNVYEFKNNAWQIKYKNLPTFNHQLYKRFRKNFAEYCQDKFHLPLYLLSTCEYGDKYHRPHYHCFCAYPSKVSWQQFKNIIESYWHYGFTKNIALVNYDGQDHNRTLLNCVKYVVKYVCKFERKWLPVYLRDKSLQTDFPLYEIEPKVFVSNHFGSALESVLTDAHYMNNSIFMQLVFDKNDKGRDYRLPQYYRRRHFVSTRVLSRESFFPVPQGLPYEKNFPLRKKFRYVTSSVRLPGYSDLLFKNFKTSLRTMIFDYLQLCKRKDFVNYMTKEIAPDGEPRFKDLSLSPSLFDDVTKCWCESFSYECSFSVPKYKDVTLRQYYVPSPLTILNSQQMCLYRKLSKVPLNLNSQYEYKDWMVRASKVEKENLGLPWNRLKSFSWKSKRIDSFF